MISNYYLIPIIVCLIGLVLLLLTSILSKKLKIGNYIIKQDDYLDNLLKILTKNIKRPYKEFVISEKLKFRLTNNIYDYDSLNNLMKDIFKHLKFPCTNVVLEINNEHYYSDSNYAGKYKIENKFSPTIELIIKPNYTVEIVTAILAHECMHFYMNFRNLRQIKTEDNEMLTDISAIYMGFGKYINKGYTSTNIGYIKSNQIIYIYNKITNKDNLITKVSF